MSEEKVFLIRIDQLKEMCSSKNPDTRMNIMIDVMGRPYREKSALDVIGNGISKSFAALEEICIEERPKKKQ